jgi:chemotaxis protein MotA
MDLATIIGLVAGFAFIIISMSQQPTPLSTWINLPSIMITIGGHIAAFVVAFPVSRVFQIFKVGSKAFNEPKIDYIQLIETLVEKSEKARRDGLLALDDEAEELPDEFLKKGIRLVVDGTEPELVKGIMYDELDKLEERHGRSADMFSMLGTFAPAFGLIGTLIGLIGMLSNLGGDKSAIGIGMSTALITTLYGTILANLVHTPISKKLENRSSDEILEKEIMLEGTLSIQSGENPRILRQKLASFLPPNIREQVERKDTLA